MRVSFSIKNLGSLTEQIKRSEKLFRYVDDKRKKALNRSGGLVRAVARRSMRKPNRAYKAANFTGDWSRIKDRGKKPPLRWMNRKGGGGLYRGMIYVYDPTRKEVVVGPVGFTSGVPGAIEAGGARRIQNKRRRKRVIGSGGEVAVAARMPFSKRGGRLKTTSVTLNRFGNARYVRYMKIRTAAQAAKANRLNKELYGPKELPLIAKPHPFMSPVIENPINQQKILHFFQG